MPKRSWLLSGMLMLSRIFYVSTLGVSKFGLQRMAIVLDRETFLAKLSSFESCDHVTQVYAMLKAEGIRPVVWNQTEQSGLPAVYGWREFGRDLLETARFWWNHLKFPGERSGQTISAANSASEDSNATVSSCSAGNARVSWLEAVGLICLLVVAGILLFRHLDYPLFEPDEARNSEIALTVLETGNWERLELDGEPYWDKPPFLAWSIASAYQLLGRSEAATRLPGVLSAAVALWATWYFARRLGGPLVAFLAATCLLLSTGFIIASRFVTMDAMLTAAVTVTLYAAWLATSKGPKLRWNWWIVSALSCGIGVLIKGPIVVVLTAPVWVAYRCLAEKGTNSVGNDIGAMQNNKPQSVNRSLWVGRWLRPGSWIEGAQKLCCWNLNLRAIAVYAAIVFGLASPWFIVNGLHDPEFLKYYFWKHHVLRFSSAFNHQEPFWFYVPTLTFCLLPVSILLPIWFRWWWPNDQRRYLRRSEIGLAFLHVVWVLGFFSLSQSKIVTYVLPAVPSICIMLGAALAAEIRQTATQNIATNEGKTESWLHWVLINQTPMSLARTSTFVAIGALITLIWINGHDNGGMKLWLLCVGISCLAWIIAEWRHYRRIGPDWNWGIVAIPCLCCVFLVTNEVIPGIALKRSIMADLQFIRSESQFAEHPVLFFAHSSHASEFWFEPDQLVHFELEDIHRVDSYFREHPYSVVVTHSDNLGIFAQALGDDFEIMRYTDGRRMYIVQPKAFPVARNASLEPYSAPSIVSRRR